MTQLPSSTCDEMFSIPLYWTKFYVTESFTIASSVKYSTAKSANTFLPVYVLCSQFKNQPTIVYLVQGPLHDGPLHGGLFAHFFMPGFGGIFDPFNDFPTTYTYKKTRRVE